jgi:hypothetical protein
LANNQSFDDEDFKCISMFLKKVIITSR